MNEIENILKSIAESEMVIKSNENFVGMGLWNIGNELKYIRDNKTYVDKSYKSFEEYVENELNYSRSQTYNFISIAESYNVQSIGQIGHLGMVKLLALSKLEEPQREEFIANNPVDEMKTKELQQAIKDRDKSQKERDEALKTLEITKKIANEKSEEAKRLEDALKVEKEKLKKEKENSKIELAKIQTFIGEAKDSGDSEEVARLQASLQEIQNDLDSSALKIDELEAQLKEKPIDVTETIIEKIPEEVEKELQEYRRKANQNDSPLVKKFRENHAVLNQFFQNQLEVMDGIKETDEETYEKCKSAISNLISKMSERL